MSKGFQEVLEKFTSLGGIADNICQREGSRGRGIFADNAMHNAKIMTPVSLFVDANNICIDAGEIVLKDKSSYTNKEIDFLGTYYNDYSWGNNGNSGSASFLRFMQTVSDSVSSQLVKNGFIDKSTLSLDDDCNHLLKRFVRERVVSFRGRLILAPVWEFVNHDSFVPPFRVTPGGVETPPIEPGSGEILFKYGVNYSPILMWRKYGFASECTVAYSIPFKINLPNHELSLCCSGTLGLNSSKELDYTISRRQLLIKSLPVGCISAKVTQNYLRSILSLIGVSRDVVSSLFLQICELNIQARQDLLNSLGESHSFAEEQLRRALMYEIDLISHSLDT